MSQAIFKADLHVHSYQSGQAKHMRLLRPRDCYSAPLDVYHTARRRGMDLVTITDHDSIDGCLEVLSHFPDAPDFMIGEEVTAYVPEFRHSIHVAVYDINEAQHREISYLRRDASELAAYLRQERILFALNHFFHDYTNLNRLADYVRCVTELFDVFETRNGAMQREHNNIVVKLLASSNGSGKQFSTVGGSDSHTLRRIGTTYTASQARTRGEFLEDIRQGRSVVCGRHADHRAIAADIYGVVLRYYPNVLSNRLKEFSALARIKNIAVSFALSPFLFIPYLVALRHAHRERERMRRIAQALQAETAR